MPDPPGFAPIPISDTPQVLTTYSGSENQIPCFCQVSAPAASSGAVAAAAVSSSASHSGGAAAAQAARSAASPPKAVRQTSATMSVQEKQLAGLLKRQVSTLQCIGLSASYLVLLSPHWVEVTLFALQTMFKQAALAAKQQGQTDTAKEYLK